ncbi:MAG TPA: RNA polymerase sigma-70 factor [Rhodothermia bacterium]|nr:RNA polymerase sigma-70 factor [Rhodothermia bacterium]
MLPPNHPHRDRPLDDLARRLSLGDRAAFEEIFSRLGIPLGRYAGRLAGEITAADVVQDVFLKLWERRAELAVHTSLQAMLYTMVRNRCLNVARDDGRRAHESLNDAIEADRQPSPEEIASAEDLRRHVNRWIGELPPRRAEAFTLSRFEGLAHQDIAEIMGISRRTVDTHILHALKHLRDRLEAFERQTMPL